MQTSACPSSPAYQGDGWAAASVEGPDHLQRFATWALPPLAWTIPLFLCAGHVDDTEFEIFVRTGYDVAGMDGAYIFGVGAALVGSSVFWACRAFAHFTKNTTAAALTIAFVVGALAGPAPALLGLMVEQTRLEQVMERELRNPHRPAWTRDGR